MGGGRVEQGWKAGSVGWRRFAHPSHCYKVQCRKNAVTLFPVGSCGRAMQLERWKGNLSDGERAAWPHWTAGEQQLVAQRMAPSARVGSKTTGVRRMADRSKRGMSDPGVHGVVLSSNPNECPRRPITSVACIP